MNQNNLLSPTSDRRFLSITLAKVSISQMVQSLDSIFSSFSGTKFERSENPLDIFRIYEIAPPAGGSHLFKLVVYSPISTPNNSVLITNLADGWSSLSYLLAKEHREYQIQVISTQVAVEFSQNRLEIWRGGTSTRLVMAMRDSDKWVFFQKGDPENFEDLANYSRRIKSQRLDRKILLDYLARAGFDLMNDLFWKANGQAYYYHETRKK